MADQLRLSRRMCRDLRTAFRAATIAKSVPNMHLTSKEFEAWNRVEEFLDSEKKLSTVRGGRVLNKNEFYRDSEVVHRILRDLMLRVLESCTQMQVRSALKKHIITLDEWSGTSAVESLGRIVEMQVA